MKQSTFLVIFLGLAAALLIGRTTTVRADVSAVDTDSQPRNRGGGGGGGESVPIAPTSVPGPTIIPTTIPPSVAPRQDNVISITTPDETKWYNTLTPTFTLVPPPGVISIRMSYNADPNGLPKYVYPPTTTQKQYKKIADGVWYYHVQFKTKNGWGPVITKKFKIDTSKPKVSIEQKMIKTASSTASVQFKFGAIDQLSSVNHYNVQVDGRVPFVWSGNQSQIYDPLNMSSGTHTIKITAYDNAGNFASASTSFVIPEKGVALSQPAEDKDQKLLLLKNKDVPSSALLIFGVNELEKIVNPASGASSSPETVPVKSWWQKLLHFFSM
jgi:hypothetical protein